MSEFMIEEVVVSEENSETIPEFDIEIETKTYEEVLEDIEKTVAHIGNFLNNLNLDEKHTPLLDIPSPTLTQTTFRDWIIDAENLPAILRPFISSEKILSEEYRTYKSLEVGLLDSNQQLQSIHLNFMAENLYLGALGGVSLGFLVGSLRMPESLYTLASGWTKDFATLRSSPPLISVSYMTLASRIAKRAAIGGFAFDFFRRNMEQIQGNRHWSNSVGAAALCGGIFGLKGGLKSCALGAAVFSVGVGIWELCPTLHSIT